LTTGLVVLLFGGGAENAAARLKRGLTVRFASKVRDCGDGYCGAMLVKPGYVVSVLALVAALTVALAAGLARAANPRPPRNAASAARGYLRALKSEQGSKICPLVSDATKRAFIDQARSDGLRVRRCEPAADHDFHKIGRVLGGFHIVRVVVHQRVAYATVNDAAVSDSGNDTFLFRKSRDGRWLVDDS